MSKPHIMAIPMPGQGHVMPLMEFSQCLAHHGFKVTFVNTEEIHEKVMNARTEESRMQDHIHLVSIPDGLEPEDRNNGIGVLAEAAQGIMRQKLEELIETINNGEDGKITCLIANESSGWALEVARKMKITKVVGFWSAAAATLVLNLSIPKLIHEGIIDEDGVLLKTQMVHLAPKMPIVKSTNFAWYCSSDPIIRNQIFHYIKGTNNNVKLVDRLVCNSAYELEPAAFALEPQILPIGPLLASRIYVAFGSTTQFDHTQFQELALALQLLNRPFLWVVRPDISDSTTYPEGYQERVGSNGLMVGWAPQQNVLPHPAISCFLSHCGWNSTIEGVSNGVPFLCWPYFADQFLNESYICDVWKVGLRFDKNENGIITRGEIKNRVEQLLGDEDFKEKALKLKEIAISNVKEGGQSDKIYKNFIEWINS